MSTDVPVEGPVPPSAVVVSAAFGVELLPLPFRPQPHLHEPSVFLELSFGVRESASLWLPLLFPSSLLPTALPKPSPPPDPAPLLLAVCRVEFLLLPTPCSSYRENHVYFGREDGDGTTFLLVAPVPAPATDSALPSFLTPRRLRLAGELSSISWLAAVLSFDGGCSAPGKSSSVAALVPATVVIKRDASSWRGLGASSLRLRSTP